MAEEHFGDRRREYGLTEAVCYQGCISSLAVCANNIQVFLASHECDEVMKACCLLLACDPHFSRWGLVHLPGSGCWHTYLSPVATPLTVLCSFLAAQGVLLIGGEH